MKRMVCGLIWMWLAMSMIGAAAQDAASSPAAAPETPEIRVKVRVESFWAAKKERKLDVCYEMLTRASRETMTMVDYIRRNNTRILDYTVDSIQIDPDDSTRALVEILCDIHVMGRKMSNIRNRQQWLLEDGEWRCVHANRSPFDRSAEQAAAAASMPRSGNTDAELQKRREAIERIRQKYGHSPSLTEAVGGSPAAPAAGQPAETAKTDGPAVSGQTAADGKTKTTADDKSKTSDGAAADKAPAMPATKSGTSTDKQKKDPPPGI